MKLTSWDKMTHNSNHGNLEYHQHRLNKYGVHIPLYSGWSEAVVHNEIVTALGREISNQIIEPHMDLIKTVITNHAERNILEISGKVYMGHNDTYVSINNEHYQSFAGQYFTDKEIKKALKKVYPERWV